MAGSDADRAEPEAEQKQTGSSPSRLVRLSTMRATIAARLTKSQRETAHVTLFREVDVSELSSFVEQQKESSGVSYTDVFIRAAAAALRQHPYVNSVLEPEGMIRLLDDINISLAVALPGGLITPVIRNADRLSLLEISKLAKELAEKARRRKLNSMELAGGTFTVSSLGMFGIEGFTPIINPPQVAILGIGSIRERPWVEKGVLVVRHTVHLSLTFDHRVVDGGDAALFLNTLVTLLASPSTAQL